MPHRQRRSGHIEFLDANEPLQLDGCRQRIAQHVLEPHAQQRPVSDQAQRIGLPADVRVVWLDRDHRQQAKSHAKFLQILSGAHYDRAGRRALAASLARDTSAALRLIGSRPLLRMRFEEVLSDPRHAAFQLRSFIGDGDFDIDAAALAVRRRSAACAPGLDMEVSLMEAA